MVREGYVELVDVPVMHQARSVERHGDKLKFVPNELAIVTPRLRLNLLSREVMESLRDGDIPRASHLQGSEFTDDFLASINDVFLNRQIDALRSRPTAPGWAVRCIVRKDDGALVGHCGFHGPPEDVGRAEIGYTIFVPYRRQGYATESAKGLVDWAAAQGSREVFASVVSHNEASLGVVNKLGFRRRTEYEIGDDNGAGQYVFVIDV